VSCGAGRHSYYVTATKISSRDYTTAANIAIARKGKWHDMGAASPHAMEAETLLLQEIVII